MHTVFVNGDVVEVRFYGIDGYNVVQSFPNTNKEGMPQAVKLASVLNGAPDIAGQLGTISGFFSWAKTVLDKKLKEEENGR